MVGWVGGRPGHRLSKDPDNQKASLVKKNYYLMFNYLVFHIY